MSGVSGLSYAFTTFDNRAKDGQGMTTQTIRNGASIEVPIPTGQTLKVVAVTGTYTITVVRGTGIGTTLSTLATGASYGPYAYDRVVRLVSSDASEIDFDVAVTPVVDSDTEPKFAFDSTGAVTGLVGPGGMTYAHDGYKKTGVSVAGVTSFGVLDQLSTGEYVCIDTTNGDYARKILLFSGDPITKVGTITPMPLTSATTGNALLDTTGAAIPVNAATKIVNAWATSNGDVYYLVFDTGLKNHLYRAKAGTFTVGSDAGYSNKRACIDLGLQGGVQASSIRSLSHRTFLEARVAGVSHLFLCEYNVNGSRTPGVGGAGADQVGAGRSISGGNNWASFPEVKPRR